jgi:tRNA(Ile)-lysidine synthase
VRGRLRVHDRAVRFPIEQEVARRLREAGVGAGERVAVGCSGGADSAALACAVAELGRHRRLAGATLIHVDHGLREGSAADGERVAELADALGLEFRPARVQVARRASPEAATHEARYAAFEAIARELGEVRVLLAHTASDQAETVLMRMLRGAGVVGLAGIPFRRGRYVRPLLRVRRAEVEAYLAARGVEPVIDPSNAEPIFLRNRVRHRHLPALVEENPRIEEALARLADAARGQREVLDYAAARLREQAQRSEGLDVAVLAAAPEAAVARALALAAEEATGRPVGPRQIDALLRLCRRIQVGSAEVALPGGRAVREYQHLRFEGADEGGAEAPSIVVQGGEGPYIVRLWRLGERFRPRRLRGRSRKLSDLYADARVPKRLREQARVVVRERDGVIAWAEHLGLAHGVDLEVTLTPPEQLTRNRG